MSRLHPRVTVSSNGASGSALRSAGYGGGTAGYDGSTALAISGALGGSRALVLARSGFSGQHGRDAPLALDGEHAPTFALTLVPNEHGGFSATRSTGKLEAVVALNEELFIIANGGDGEDGGTGGNGADGRPGGDGVNATRYSNGTSGENGGAGGNGGRGTNGGNGGNGGNINVIVSEDNMHLIYAVSWEAQGGKGGQAGKHGKPGRGGPGGRGGSSYSWSEHTGYRWNCVDHGSSGGELVPYSGGSLQSGRALGLYMGSGAYITDGTNRRDVSNAVVRIPASMGGQVLQLLGEMDDSNSRALTTTSSGGHASGCQQVATYTTLSNPGGRRGSKGPSGSAPTHQLYPGSNGASGNASYKVVSNDGTSSVYSSKFEFELISFDVVDENDDGIFEPGECVLIRNIMVKNIGGMPSPKLTHIPVRILSTEWLTPIDDYDDVYLPLGIPPGSTMKCNGTLWAMMKMPPQPSPANEEFQAKTTIRLEATIPDILWEVNNFNLKKRITLNYPFRLDWDHSEWLDAVPQGYLLDLSWDVMNISTRAAGIDSQDGRRVYTTISCPSSSVALGRGAFVEVADFENPLIEQEITLLGDQCSHRAMESIEISSEAAECSKFEVTIRIFASRSLSRAADWREDDIIKMQTSTKEIQITKPWSYNRDAKVVLLTSNNVSERTLKAWKAFIRKELHSCVDVWNLSENAGFVSDVTEDRILHHYAGKSVIALDDAFDFGHYEQRNVLDFLDPNEACSLLRKRTSFMLVREQVSPQTALSPVEAVRKLVYSPALSETGTSSRSNSQPFESCQDFLNSLELERQTNAGWIGERRYSVKAKGGKRLNKVLRKEYPLDRFVVQKRSDTDFLDIVHCLPFGQNFSIYQDDPHPTSISSEKISGLPLSMAYACISALPLPERLSILQQPAIYSEFVRKAAKFSVKLELYQQVKSMTNTPRWSHTIFSYHYQPQSTRPLADYGVDKIAETLAHEISMPDNVEGGHGLSEDGREIIASILLSARCQSIPQLLLRLLSPFRRTRSHVRKNLMTDIEGHLTRGYTRAGSTAEEARQRFTSFQKTVRQPVRQKSQRARITDKIRDLTAGGIKNDRDAFVSAENAFRSSTYLPDRVGRLMEGDLRGASSQRQEDLDRIQKLKVNHRLRPVGRHGLGRIPEVPNEMGPGRPRVTRSSLVSARRADRTTRQRPVELLDEPLLELE